MAARCACEPKASGAASSRSPCRSETTRTAGASAAIAEPPATTGASASRAPDPGSPFREGLATLDQAWGHEVGDAAAHEVLDEPAVFDHPREDEHEQARGGGDAKDAGREARRRRARSAHDQGGGEQVQRGVERA